MNFNIVLSYLVPKNKIFYSLFAQAGSNLEDIGSLLDETMKNHSNVQRHSNLARIIELELKGDTITHEIIHRLGTDFIVPFDRADIHDLAVAIDDVAALICAVANRLQLYKIEKCPAAAHLISAILYRQCQEIHIAVHHLGTQQNLQRIKQSVVKINSSENEADDIFEVALGRLLETETDAIELMKQKEILALLETATDKCEDVSNILETIFVKMQ